MILCVSCYSYLGQMQEEVQWESVKQQSPPPFTQTRGAMLAFYHLHRDLVLAWA